MVEDVEAALSDAAAARAAGADLVEFRIDGLFHGDHVQRCARAVGRLCEEAALPCIVTCRSASEGGEYEGDDPARAALWEVVGRGEHPPRYVDVELAAFQRSAEVRRKVGLAVGGETGLILSAHDFKGRPGNLTRVVAEMSGESAARVNKVAWRARSIRDNLEAFEILGEASRPTIALCMGEFGLMSRVLVPKFGGFLTFASLRESSATAPGQPTVRELLGRYRFRSIGRGTRVYGVIGWPVGHSASPAVHNAGFDEVGFDGVYVPMAVPPEWEHFKATLHALLDFGGLDFRGASVTLPHKGHLVRFAREDSSRRWSVDRVAGRCGAGNTLVVGEDGSCRVMNTDAAAAVGAVREAAGEVGGVRVGVIGAGGVARGVVAGFVEAGARVTVYARDRSKAERLVSEYEGGRVETGVPRVGEWGRRGTDGNRIVVNCTPIGMKGGGNESEMPLEGVEGMEASTVIVETVYSPITTPLVRAARSAGLKTVAGDAMFVGQAAAQFEAWTGRPAPAACFRRVLHETLVREDS